MGIAAGTLLFAVGCVLPGLLVATVLIRDREPLAVWTLGIVIGVFCLPLVQFSAAMLLRTNINAVLVLAVGAVVGGGAVVVGRRREEG